MARNRVQRPHYGVRLQQGKTVILIRSGADSPFWDALATISRRGGKELADMVYSAMIYTPSTADLDRRQAAWIIAALDAVDGYGEPGTDQLINALAWWFDCQPYPRRAGWWYAAVGRFAGYPASQAHNCSFPPPDQNPDWVEHVCSYVRDVLAHDQAELDKLM